MEKIKVGVVGGGASGMMAAISAARKGAEVTILEGGERVGKKLLSTGNGKCNLGNLSLSPEDYHCGRREWLRDCLERFDQQAALSFFQNLGMLVKDRGGYLYPVSEQASTVLDVLRSELKNLGITVITGCKISSIERSKQNKIVLSEGARKFCFDRVILACGGKAAPKTGSDGSGYRLAKALGHRVIPVVPALGQLTCREAYLKAVAGVRCGGEVRIYQGEKCVACERGEIQFADYGISGIPVFQLSRTVNYLLQEQRGQTGVRAVLNLLPDLEEEAFRQLQEDRKRLAEGRTVEEFFTGLLHKKLMMLFVKLAGLRQQQPAEEAEAAALQRVYELCRHFELQIEGNRGFDNAQVCAGGVDVAEVTKDLESVLAPGIYFAGELLDVDGRCGGYNLHWAWCSGYLAGCGAARPERPTKETGKEA